MVEISFGFWEGFKGVSASREIALTGKRFAIVVDDKLPEILRDVDGW